MQVEVVQICEVVSEYCTGRVCDVEHSFQNEKSFAFLFYSFLLEPTTLIFQGGLVIY